MAAAAAATASTDVSEAPFTAATEAVAELSAGTLGVEVTPATVPVAVPGLRPGDVVTTPLTVRQTGSAALRYSVSGLSDATDGDQLAAWLLGTLRTGVASCTDAGFEGSGTVLSGPVPLAATAGRRLLGNPAQGEQPGDRVLGVGAAETLCLQVALASRTPPSLAGRAVRVHLRVDAEQTANNP